MPGDGTKNLRKPWTPEEASYYGSIGGRKTAERHKRKKAMRELATAMVNNSVNQKSAAQLKKLFPELDGEDMTIAAGIIAKQITNALQGDLASAKWLQTLQDGGEMQADVSEDELSRSLRELADEIDERKHAGQ